MALGGKTSKKFYVTSGGGADEINSTRKTALDAFNTADAAAGYKQLIDDNTLGPLIVNLQEMQDDIDELRRYVDTASELRGKISPLPLANGGTGTATQTDQGIPTVNAGAGTIGTSADLVFHHGGIYVHDTLDNANYGRVGVGANGSMDITSYDDVGTSAHITITSDGQTTIDAASSITLDSGGDIALKASGSSKGAFKLDQVGSGCEMVGIQQVVIDLNQAQLNLISTANSNKGYVIIPALGSGLMPVVLSMHTHTIMASGTQNTVAQDFYLEYDDGVTKDLNQCIYYQRRFMNNMGTGGFQRLEEWRPYRFLQSTQAYPAWVNKAVYLSANANPTAGSYTSIRVMVTFHVVKF
jgi:hypothetical protein